jgi:hypothetical protein
MNTHNNVKSKLAGRVSIRLEDFSDEESARNCLQLTLEPEFAKQLTETLHEKGLTDGGAFESDLKTWNFVNQDEGQILDRTLRNTILRGIITKQIAITDRIELTDQATPSFIREISTALQDPITLIPDISIHNFDQKRIIIDQKYQPSIWELMKEVAAATKIIDGKYNEVRGVLGNPVSGVDFGARDSYYRKYERGAIYLSPSGIVHEVHGAIYQKYLALGAEASFLGLPESDELSTVLSTGRFNHFQGGTIYWTPVTGAWEIHGAIRNKWWQLDGDRSYLGYPISDEENWVDPTVGQTAGRISHFQNGSIVSRWSDSSLQVINHSVILKTSLSSSSVTSSCELWMNSAGDWRYKGHMHNSGFVGYNVNVISTPRFQDINGNIFACQIEAHVGGTTNFDGRDEDWDQVGSQETFIRENWGSLEFAGMKTVMKIDSTAADIVELIGTGFIIAVGAIIVGAVLAGGKVCPAHGSMYRDPYDHTDHPQVTFEVVGNDEQCH